MKKKDIEEQLEEVENIDDMMDGQGEPPQEEPQEQDNRTLGEKIEDTMDDVVGGVQDFIYGEKGNYNEDIPATWEKDSGIRKVNRYQTRRNINKKLGIKGILGIFLGMFALCIAIVVIVGFVALIKA